MTEKDIETLAELIFKKMLKKQSDWDNQFLHEIKSKVGRDAIVIRIKQLKLMKLDLVKKEDYEQAHEVQKEIKKLESELNNDED